MAVLWLDEPKKLFERGDTLGIVVAVLLVWCWH